MKQSSAVSAFAAAAAHDAAAPLIDGLVPFAVIAAAGGHGQKEGQHHQDTHGQISVFVAVFRAFEQTAIDLLQFYDKFAKNAWEALQPTHCCT